MRSALGNGAPVCLGIDHREYRHQRTLTGESRAALIADLDPA